MRFLYPYIKEVIYFQETVDSQPAISQDKLFEFTILHK